MDLAAAIGEFLAV